MIKRALCNQPYVKSRSKKNIRQIFYKIIFIWYYHLIISIYSVNTEKKYTKMVCIKIVNILAVLCLLFNAVFIDVNKIDVKLEFVCISFIYSVFQLCNYQAKPSEPQQDQQQEQAPRQDYTEMPPHHGNQAQQPQEMTREKFVHFNILVRFNISFTLLFLIPQFLWFELFVCVFCMHNTAIPY